MISRRIALLAGAAAGLAAPRPVRADLAPEAVAALLGGGEHLAIQPELAPWGPPAEGLTAAALAVETETLVVALLRAGAGGAPEAVAGPLRVDALTVEPIWGGLIRFTDQHPLPADRPVIAIELTNRYASTGRATATRALHLFLREGASLRQVFAGFTGIDETIGRTCPEEQPDCRLTLHRRWVIEAVPDGPMPALRVRNAEGGIVSRHRWTDGRYDPPLFEISPELDPS